MKKFPEAPSRNLIKQFAASAKSARSIAMYGAEHIIFFRKSTIQAFRPLLPVLGIGNEDDTILFVEIRTAFIDPAR